MMLVNSYQTITVIPDVNNLLKVMEELLSYLVNLNQNGQIFPKIYFSFFGVGGDKYDLVIVIKQDEYFFNNQSELSN